MIGAPVYLYAIVGGEPREALGSGIAGELLLSFRCGDLVAVVGAMEAVPPLQETSLRGHDAVIRRLADVYDAILPARFGGLFDDAAALAAHLVLKRAPLLDALALVHGREQITVRLFASSPSPAPAGDLGPGARYLAERRLALPALDRLRKSVAPLVHGERVERHHTPPLAASVHHLIARGASDAYRAALAADPIEAFITSGSPWPPYAFAPAPEVA